MRHTQIATHAARMLLAAALPALLLAAPASAQTPVEIGIGIGNVSMINLDGGGAEYPGVDFRLAAPLNRLWSIEGVATISHHQAYGLQTTLGTYGVLFRRYFSEGTVSPFVTVGALGTYEASSTPRWSYSETTPPVFAVVGGGVRARINTRLSAQGCLEGITLLLYPVGLRATASLSVRIGPEHR